MLNKRFAFFLVCSIVTSHFSPHLALDSLEVEELLRQLPEAEAKEKINRKIDTIILTVDQLTKDEKYFLLKELYLDRLQPQQKSQTFSSLKTRARGDSNKKPKNGSLLRLVLETRAKKILNGKINTIICNNFNNVNLLTKDEQQLLLKGLYLDRLHQPLYPMEEALYQNLFKNASSDIKLRILSLAAEENPR